MKGLIKEKEGNGKTRYRVRVKGNPRSRITLTKTPIDDGFLNEYLEARRGIAGQRLLGDLVKGAAIRRVVSKAVNSAKSRASAKGWEYDLSLEYILGLVTEQNEKCALSHIKFDLTGDTSWRRPYSISIDRIDNSVGYTKENVRLVCSIVNMAKADWGDDDFKKMCRQIAKVSHNK